MPPIENGGGIKMNIMNLYSSRRGGGGVGQDRTGNDRTAQGRAGQGRMTVYWVGRLWEKFEGN